MYGLASTFQSYVDASTSIENAYMYLKHMNGMNTSAHD